MVQGQNRLSFLLATLLLASVASGAHVGGWTAIKDANSPHLQELGKFAVEEHNKQAGTNLKFESVIKAERQVVAGTNYRLTLTAKIGAASKKYQAIVWEKLDATKNLTSFKPLLTSIKSL